MALAWGKTWPPTPVSWPKYFMDQHHNNNSNMVPSGETPGPRGISLATGEEHRDDQSSGGISDVDRTNPSGLLSADVATSKMRFLRCTKVTKIGTWNVNGMNIGKLDIVKKEMNRLNIDILGVSEVHWTGNGFFNTDDHTMYFSGNSNTRRRKVGFTLCKKISKCVVRYFHCCRCSLFH
jgi:hypothetical protein